MIDNFIITVSGFKELIAMNNTLISKLEEQTILENIMDSIVEKAKELAPIKTGALIDSLKWAKIEDAFAIMAIYYAEFLEFGIRIPVGDTDAPRSIISGGGKTAYLPFIRPSIYQSFQNINNELKNLLDEIYKK